MIPPSPEVIQNLRAATPSEFLVFLLRPYDLLSLRINLELHVILQTVDRTPWTGYQSCRKAAIYMYAGQHKYKRDAMN
jgi:hypothetical protein